MSSTAKSSKAPRIFAIVICVLIVMGLFPMRYLTSPHWEVRVVTEDGQPLPGINVRLEYQDYSAEGQDHELTLVTDASGHCVFPAQFEKHSFFLRVFYSLLSAVNLGVHAGFGRHAFVFAFGGGYEGDAVSGEYVTDWTGSPAAMESRIVAKRKGK